SAFEDQEKAVHYFEHYGLPILPVVDSEGVLLGSITFDDILEIAKEEATEDFHKTASVSPLETPYMQTKVLDFFKKRVGWLIALIFVNVISGFAMAHFEELIQAVTALVFFIPLIIDSGGNAGSQSSAMIIRAFATGEVHLKQWWEVVLKDLLVSMMLGISMGFAVSFLGIYRGGILMGLSIALSMAAVVIAGSLLGTILPFVLRVFKLDPATASSPLITSMADILGVIFFFSISQALIGL
ncbi:MAG: magnesium transporter, partial [Spirochaetota bacterium]|nr:magnesium transporter [Spirochaetota bacterium]